ncbi:MAG: hypothetical protein ABMA64_27505 [Myxococcota bacterium]
MIHTDHRFSDAVAAKVTALEQATDAEVVVVAAPRSGQYRDVALTLAAGLTFATLAALLVLPWPIHPALALLDLVGVWALGGWWLAGNPLSARLAGEARRTAQVREAAAAEFHREAVHATPRRTGLLVYVSAWEQQVELIPDVGIEARVPRGKWPALTGAASGVEPFLAALDAIGVVLAEHVPATHERGVELADAPRIR